MTISTDSRGGSTPPSTGEPADWVTWANDLPNFIALGMTCTTLNEVVAEFSLQDSTFPLNPNGAVNGGIVSAVADQAMGVMAQRAAGPDSYPVTASLHVQYHSAAIPPLRIETRLLNGGRRVKYVDVHVFDRDETHCASGHGTMVVTNQHRTG